MSKWYEYLETVFLVPNFPMGVKIFNKFEDTRMSVEIGVILTLNKLTLKVTFSHVLGFKKKKR